MNILKSLLFFSFIILIGCSSVSDEHSVDILSPLDISEAEFINKFKADNKSDFDYLKEMNIPYYLDQYYFVVFKELKFNQEGKILDNNSKHYASIFLDSTYLIQDNIFCNTEMTLYLSMKTSPPYSECFNLTSNETSILQLDYDSRRWGQNGVEKVLIAPKTIINKSFKIVQNHK